MKNAQVVRESIETIWNRGELDRLSDFYTDDFHWHQSSTSGVFQPGVGLFETEPADEWVPGFSGVERIVRLVRTAFPDYHEEPEIVIEDGGLVAVRQIVTGTNAGSWKFAATNESFRVVDMMICRVRDGKLAEQWGLFDQYSLITQLHLHELATRTS